MFRLRAIREYFADGRGVSGEKRRYWEVTFSDDPYGVVAESHFWSEEAADFVVDAVNGRYDKTGEPFPHCLEWQDETD